jgi:hypothetical protein
MAYGDGPLDSPTAPPAPALVPFSPQKPQSDLADVLERVLDTGVVLVGDVGLVINGTEILSLRVRLLVSSIDKADEVGLDWWRHEPAFSSVARTRLPTPAVRLRRTRRPSLSAAVPAVAPSP